MDRFVDPRPHRSCARHPGSGDCFPSDLLTRRGLLGLRETIARRGKEFGVVAGSDFDPVEHWQATVEDLIASHLAALDIIDAQHMKAEG